MSRVHWTPRHTFLALVTAVLLLAALSRIYNLIQRPIWTDEGTTTFNLFHFNEQPSLIEGLARRDHHPPVYYWLMQGWMALTGESVLALRYFSTLMGVLCVAAIVPLAREFGVGASIPILAALALALSDPDIDLSQEIRFYTWRTLLVILSAWFYLRWTRRPTQRRALPWLLTNLVLLHTNYQGAFIIFFEGLHTLLFLRGRTRWLSLGWLTLSGLLFLPWFATYGFNQRLNDQGINSTLPSTWETFVELVYKFLGRQWPLMTGLMLLGLAALVATPPARLRAWGGWLAMHRVELGKAFLLLAWIGLTLFISFFANQWFSILSPRRIMLVSPALALLVALGLSRFRPRTQLFLAAVLLVYGVTTVDDYYPKAPWDNVAQAMARYARPDELVLMEIYYDDTVMFYYVDTLLPPDTTARSLRMWRQFHAETYPQGVYDLLNQHQTVWLVHWDKDLSAFEMLRQTGYTQTALMTTDHWGNALSAYRFDRLAPNIDLTFSNGMRLEQFVIDPASLRVDLWWSADKPLDQDYSVSVFLLDEAGRSVAQYDAFPFENRRPTTGWQPGEVIYDPHPLPADNLAPGRYQVAVQIYTYWDSQNFPTLAGERWHIIGTLER